MQVSLNILTTSNRRRLHVTAGNYRKLWFLFLAGLFSSVPGFSQSNTFQSVLAQFNQFNQEALPEKLFLHLDRPAYVSGETMWFKVYYVDGLRHQPLNLSKLAYVEVLNQEQQAVLQGKIALQAGTGNGSFNLPTDLASGNYTVRAYTNRMKNFSPDYFFEKQVTIINTTTHPGPKEKADSTAFAVTFFPEGGNLVQNIPGKVAFKVTDKSGRGVAAEGTLVDEQGKTITTFKTLKFGMGSFTFTPTSQTPYTAVLKLASNQTIRRTLPRVFAEGYVLHLDDTDPAKLNFTVQAKITDLNEGVYLLGHARGSVAVSEAIRLNNGQATFVLDKKSLTAGITHFTLFNAANKPVCERLYFIRPTTDLTITTQTDKPTYEARDKVSLQVGTSLPAGTPAASNLSLAVYRLDSVAALTPADINSYFWLSSDLRGTIENPGYYFAPADAQTREATDNLMLTHGWSRFRWEDILNSTPVALSYMPEINGHFVRGRVTNAQNGTPVAGINTYLAFPGRNIRFYNTISKENGEFLFEVKDAFGPKELVAQTNTTQDSIYHIEVFSPFIDKYSSRPVVPFQLSEGLKEVLASRNLQMQVQNAYYAKFKNNYKLPALDTLAFYGKPDESYLLDKFTRFKVMEEVMREYVPGVMVRIRKDGFHFLVADRTNKVFFPQNPLVLLDGVPVFDIDKIMAFDPLKIKKLDVVTRRYFQGPQTFEGVVSYTTYGGDLGGFALDTRALVQEYEGMQLQREFYAPSYDSPALRQSRLPDYRNLLYWNPTIISQDNTPQSLQFYTGDQAGKYIIVVQGMAADGSAGSSITTFEVKQAW